MRSKMLAMATLIVVLFLPMHCLASSCSVYQEDKAQHFAELAGEKIISKYGGGQDERVELESCEYNSYSESFKLEIDVHWNGAFNSDNYYNIEGILKLDSDGTNTEFSQTYANQNVEDLEFFGKLVGATIFIGALAAESESGSN